MAYTSIFFGLVDSAAIEAEIVAYYVSLTGRTPNPSDPEFAINATIAYARVLNIQALDRAGKANLIEFATGTNLDNLGKIIGIFREAEQPSLVKIKFTLVDGHLQVVIPGGTLVSSTDGQAVYATDEDITVPVGVNEVTANATCTVDGTFSNGYQLDTITTIQNPQPYLESATNIEVTSGGAEVETDENFRLRWYDKLAALSVAGPKGAYRFHARTASLSIVDVEVLGPEDGGVLPGDVEIRVLVDTGVPTQSILDAVFAACDPETVRPMNDRVKVFAATYIPYTLTIGITAFIGADVAALPDLVKAAIEAYTTVQGNNIGNDIIDDAIVAAGQIEGVKELDLGAFTNIDVNLRSFARCTNITCTVVAVEAP